MKRTALALLVAAALVFVPMAGCSPDDLVAKRDQAAQLETRAKVTQDQMAKDAATAQARATAAEQALAQARADLDALKTQQAAILGEVARLKAARAFAAPGTDTAALDADITRAGAAAASVSGAVNHAAGVVSSIERTATAVAADAAGLEATRAAHAAALAAVTVARGRLDALIQETTAPTDPLSQAGQAVGTAVGGPWGWAITLGASVLVLARRSAKWRSAAVSVAESIEKLAQKDSSVADAIAKNFDVLDTYQTGAAKAAVDEAQGKKPASVIPII